MSLADLLNRRNRRIQKEACLDILDFVANELCGEEPTQDWLERNIQGPCQVGKEKMSSARFAAMVRQIIVNGLDTLEGRDIG